MESLEPIMESQSKTQTQTNALLMPGAIVIAGVLIAGGLFLGLSGRSAPLAGTDPSQQQAPAQAADISKVKIVGQPFIGNANAPITMAYWYDYQCPFCKRHEEEAMPDIVKNYVDTGKVKVVFKDYQFLSQDSQTLGQYSRAVWETAPSKFYQWHKAVYDNQGTENTGWATQEKILSILKIALTADETSKVVQVVKTKGAAYQKLMDADKAEGTGFGINGTPGNIIGKQLVEGAQPFSVFKQVIDLALQGK